MRRERLFALAGPTFGVWQPGLLALRRERLAALPRYVSRGTISLRLLHAPFVGLLLGALLHLLADLVPTTSEGDGRHANQSKPRHERAG